MAGTSREDWIDVPDPIPAGWEIDGPPMYVEVDDLEAIHQKLADWVTVGRLAGGIFSVAAVRREIAPSMFVTEGFGIKWDSYAPAQKLEREPEPRARKPHQEQPAPVPSGPVFVEEDATAGEDDPDGIPDDHRVPGAAVLGG